MSFLRVRDHATRRSLSLALQLALAVSFAAHARAYCRLTTVKPGAGELCATKGIPAIWKRSCVGFSLTDPGPTLPPLDDMRAVADASFGTWADVQCEGFPLGIEVAQTEQLSECRIPEYNKTAPNAN